MNAVFLFTSSPKEKKEKVKANQDSLQGMLYRRGTIPVETDLQQTVTSLQQQALFQNAVFPAFPNATFAWLPLPLITSSQNPSPAFRSLLYQGLLWGFFRHCEYKPE